MSSQLEMLAATSWFWTFSVGFIVSIASSTAILFCSTLRWPLLIYFIWIWYDRKTCERGGRPIEWVRSWSWWRYMKNYFNHKLVTEDGFHLDSKKNYIFACFPHGIFPVGTFAAFVDGYQSKFPNHKPFLTALGIQFWMPVIRELFLSTGSVSVSAPSIKHLLKNNTGGNIVSILIGGGDESKYSRPGKYKIILRKRKGFVKMALQTGSPLVPVISFGETDVFDQLDFPGLQIIKNIVQKITQVVIVIPLGKSFIFPNRVAVTTIVGKPIKVEKVDTPSVEEIESLHSTFVEAIEKLFEDNKSRYVKQPAKTFLEIV